MTAELARREAGLAAVALLAALLTLAFGRGERTPAPVRPVAVHGGPWKAAVTAPADLRYGKTTACGIRLTRRTRGIAHPVLPCGVRIVVAFGGKSIATSVVERGATAAGDDFDLTAALAKALGVAGRTRIHWRFAG